MFYVHCALGAAGVPSLFEIMKFHVLLRVALSPARRLDPWTSTVSFDRPLGSWGGRTRAYMGGARGLERTVSAGAARWFHAVNTPGSAWVAAVAGRVARSRDDANTPRTGDDPYELSSG